MATKDITDRQVLEAYQKCKDISELWPYHVLQLETGEPGKVCYRAMERAEDRGLIDCGVSLRTGWITDKGCKLLQSQ